MFYKTQIKNIQGRYAFDINGKRLSFIGDYPCKAGDTVWTDGKIIFGNITSVGQTPLHIEEKSGIPVISFSGRGYFDKNGKFKKYPVNNDGFIVNNEKVFKHGEHTNIFLIGGIWDAEIAEDGSLLTAVTTSVWYDSVQERLIVDKISIYKDGVEIKAIDPVDYLKTSGKEEKIEITIKEFKVFPNADWSMIFEAYFEVPVVYTNAVYFSWEGGLSEFIETKGKADQKRIDVPSTGEGRIAMLNQISDYWQSIGFGMSIENVASSIYQDLIASVYGKLVEIREIVITTTEDEYIDTRDPRRTRKRECSKRELIKVENETAEVLTRCCNLPAFSITIATEDTDTPIHISKDAGYSSAPTLKDDEYLYINYYNGELSFKTGSWCRVEYNGLLGWLKNPDVFDETQDNYPYCVLKDIECAEGEIDETQDAEDWVNIPELSSEELYPRSSEDLFCSFPIQDDFYLNFKIDTAVYMDRYMPDTGVGFYRYRNDLMIEDVFQSDTKIIGGLSELSWLMTFNEFCNNYCATKINDSEYLLGLNGYGLFKIVNGELEPYSQDLANFRLRNLKKIAKAKK